MISSSRRQVIAAAALAATGSLHLAAMAQNYPLRPVKIVVPFAPGGPTDTSARIVAHALGRELNATFVIDNVPGAGAVIGTTRVATAPPDGYTLLWGTPSSLTIGPSVNTGLKYDANTSFAPVSLATSAPFVLVVKPSLGIHDIAGLIAHAKAHPGQLNYGSTGIGGSAHMIASLFLSTTGIRAAHVPYSGGAPMTTALRQGDIDFLFDTPTTVAPLLQSNAGQALAVTSLVRWPELPEVRTLDEAGVKGFDITTWFGLLAPRGTPADVVELLSAKVAVVLRDEGVRKSLKGSGLLAVGSTPAVFAERIRAEGAKWSQVAKAADIKVQ